MFIHKLFTIAVFHIIIINVQGWYEFTPGVGGWLKLHGPASWESAYNACWAEGALLASPINHDFKKELIKLIKKNTSYFTGISSIFYPGGQYVSVEGIPLFQMPIDDASELNTEEGKCLSMTVVDEIPVLHKVSCSSPLPFVCYRKQDNWSNSTECGTTDLRYKKSTVTGNCYKIHEVALTWDEGYSLCAVEGGHMAVINDAREFESIKQVLGWRWSYVYIGLRQWTGAGDWMTVRGERLDHVFNVWNPTRVEPVQLITDKRCAVLKKDYIEDYACNQKGFVLCERVPNIQASNGETPEYKIF